MDNLIEDIRNYLKRVDGSESWFCIVDDIGSILDAYENGE